MAFLFIIIIVAAAHTHFCCIPVTTESDTAPAKVQPCGGVLSFFLVFPHLGEGPTVAYINSHPSLSPRVSSFNALVC